MRLSRILRRILTPGRGQGGFSIAEVMVAGAVLAVVSIPVMQMFATSYRVNTLTSDLNMVQVCTRDFTEKIRAMPFYKPYTGSDRDVDDFFWGDGRGLANDWDSAPEVEMKAYNANPYPQFKVTVKMVYLDDDTSEATMRSTWGPKTTNRDDPVNSANKTLNMIKFQVKAYWMVDGVENANTNHSLVTIMTRSEVQANLGVSSCEVTDVAMQGTTTNSAPHIYNNVDVVITGFGFKPGCTATLLMAANNDISLHASYVDETTLNGYVNLASDGTAGRPWSPRAEPGGWAVRVNVGSAFAVLNDGLVAEFPRPALSGINPTWAPYTRSNQSITVTGDPIISLAPAGGYNNCRAVMRLVWCNADGTEDASRVIEPIAGTTAVAGNGYTGGADQITANYNLMDGNPWGSYPQTYYAQVWNCKDYSMVGQLGDVYTSSRTVPFTFQAIEVPPDPAQVYQTGSPARNWGFNNRTYNLTIKGEGFDPNGVTVYLGRGAVPPGAPRVQGTNVVATGDTITADFNMATMAGNEGSLWVYVRNDASGQEGVEPNVYTLRKPPGTTGVNNTDGKGYKYNYYDIAVSLSGSDYYTGYQVYYQNNAGGTVYQVGVGDGEGPPAWSSSNVMTGFLNLIGLPNATYRIWVADPYESTNIASNTTFASSYGPPVLLTSGSPYDPTSVSIKFKYRTQFFWIWSGWSGNITRSESGATRAWAPNGKSSNWLGSGGRQVRADFEVKGMGFLDAGTGSTTNLNVSNNGNNGNFAAVIDRAARAVYLRTPYWDNVDTGSSWQMATAGATTYNLVLTNNNGSGSNTYANRWETRDQNP